MGELVAWARGLAALRMADELPQRWAHVHAVAAKAENLRPVLDGDAELVVAAAWLHDVGYASTVTDSGLHALDGARLLRSLDADSRLIGLVAYHSGARYEAELRGLGTELAAFHDEASFTRDALWFCDMTTGPSGETMTFDERLAEIDLRYGSDHNVTLAIKKAADDIRAAVANVLTRVAQYGLAIR